MSLSFSLIFTFFSLFMGSISITYEMKKVEPSSPIKLIVKLYRGAMGSRFMK
jgi:hypothetical protein